MAVLRLMFFYWLTVTALAGKLSGQLCTKNSDCDSKCCVLAIMNNGAGVHYVCQSVENCVGNLIYGSSCSRSSDCSTNCCYNSQCSEFDDCFREYVKPIINSLVIGSVAMLSASTGIVWVWIFILCRRNCVAKTFHRRLLGQVDVILHQDEHENLRPPDPVQQPVNPQLQLVDPSILVPAPTTAVRPDETPAAGERAESPQRNENRAGDPVRMRDVVIEANEEEKKERKHSEDIEVSAEEAADGEGQGITVAQAPK